MSRPITRPLHFCLLWMFDQIGDNSISSYFECESDPFCLSSTQNWQVSSLKYSVFVCSFWSWGVWRCVCVCVLHLYNCVCFSLFTLHRYIFIHTYVKLNACAQSIKNYTSVNLYICLKLLMFNVKCIKGWNVHLRCCN